ncbi:MAG: hypothetical protein R3F40_15415 [Candidatus Competibacteraceae bacterium]
MHEPAWLGNMLIYLAAALPKALLAAGIGRAILGWSGGRSRHRPGRTGPDQRCRNHSAFCRIRRGADAVHDRLELEPHRLAMRRDVFGGRRAQLLACGGLLAGADWCWVRRSAPRCCWV